MRTIMMLNGMLKWPLKWATRLSEKREGGIFHRQVFSILLLPLLYIQLPLAQRKAEDMRCGLADRNIIHYIHIYIV